MARAMQTTARYLRIDLALCAFALAGLAIGLVRQPDGDPAAGGKRYALAISAGDDLRLAARSQALVGEPGQRILQCRKVVAFGPLDVGARCTPVAAASRIGLAAGD